MGVEYVDIFYSHRPDPDTPLEETMMALHQIVQSGKALYVGISNYNALQTKQALAILKELGTPCLIHQPRYSMLDRWVEQPYDGNQPSLLEVVGNEHIGCIAFSPLAQGRLTDKYLNGVPPQSRIGKGLANGAIEKSDIPPQLIQAIHQLNEIALQRRQTLAQMAIAWLLKDVRITSILVGASSLQQLQENIQSLANLSFSFEELMQIENMLK
jgi:L-glyceraldehyde 3-phosphate reductase